jgi:hypothetical protein
VPLPEAHGASLLVATKLNCMAWKPAAARTSSEWTHMALAIPRPRASGATMYPALAT